MHTKYAFYTEIHIINKAGTYKHIHKDCSMKNASAGNRSPAAEHPFAVDFRRSLKLLQNLPVKTSKLHSLRQKETKTKQANPLNILEQNK